MSRIYGYFIGLELDRSGHACINFKYPFTQDRHVINCFVVACDNRRDSQRSCKCSFETQFERHVSSQPPIFMIAPTNCFARLAICVSVTPSLVHILLALAAQQKCALRSFCPRIGFRLRAQALAAFGSQSPAVTRRPVRGLATFCS